MRISGYLDRAQGNMNDQGQLDWAKCLQAAAAVAERHMEKESQWEGGGRRIENQERSLEQSHKDFLKRKHNG